MAFSLVLGPLLAGGFIIIVAWALLKGLYPHAVLLVAGLVMLALATGLGMQLPDLAKPTGFWLFDLSRYVTESFSRTLSRVGLMIMAIGGFVAYMDSIGASEALVRVAVHPLRWFQRFPYLTTSLIIPVGQLLFVCIPSAAGMGLLLMASVFPLVVRLGVSRLTGVSVIVACTSFGIGPASAMTTRAAEIVDTPSIDYFFAHQLPLVGPTSLVMATAYFFVNRAFDARMHENSSLQPPPPATVAAPWYYAFFPVLPLVLLLVFSELLRITPVEVRLDTSTAMFMSVAAAAVVHALRQGSLRASFDSLKIFWKGMAEIFRSVVTLIIAADLFSKGLIGLGLIQALLEIAGHIGLGAVGLGAAMAVMIFMASMLMGSGNASFFAFGPLVPRIAFGLGSEPTRMILPMQLAASMGRSVSPISGVVIATANIAGIDPIDLSRRNAIPLGLSLAFLLVWHELIQ